MAWSVDPSRPLLSRPRGLSCDLHAEAVDLYLHNQGIDTTTPGGKALSRMMGVLAEFERAMIQERVCARLAKARAKGKQLGPRCPRRWRARSTLRAPLARGSWRLPGSSGLESARYAGCWACQYCVGTDAGCWYGADNEHLDSGRA
jgi:hypothetical protein